MDLFDRRVSTPVALGATLVVPLAIAGERIAATPLATLGTAAALAAGLGWRRRPPVGLACVTAAVLLAVATGQGLWPYVAAPLAAYLSGRARPAGRAAPLLAAGATAALTAGWLLDATANDPIVAFLTLVATMVLPWWIGSDARLRADLRDAGWARAAQLEHEQRLVATAVRHEERARLAADMHDALGYELSVLALTAGAGEVNPHNTAEQREQFARTRAAAVDAVDALHGILRVLREDDPAVGETAPDALTALVARHRDSGARVEAHLAVDPAGWPVALRRAVYRMTQELLANAAKHAPDQVLTLDIRASGREVTLHARNGTSARRAGVPGSGSGLSGLRDRARALGGEVAVTREAGAFDVVVTVPLPGGAPGSAGGGSSPRDGRRRWRSAVFPLAAVGVALGVLLAVNAVTVEQVGLSSEEFGELEVGMTGDETRPLLPPSHLDELPPTFTPRPAPAGAACEYYRAADTWFDIGDDYMQLCFADGTLVRKALVP
ncbi:MULTISPECIES: sensor histidine kinase [Streptomyces]|uniref:sensor histidine kinase n=1 Tax=Streptomyces TaxID=1883 RepID=UPI00186B2DEE|nr:MULTISPECIES: histidine kinase [Streptomyces]